MKAILVGTISFMMLALVIFMPGTARAGWWSASVSLPAVEFSSPPQMVVIPETNVYVIPDSDVDMYFYGGWWWRSWEGRWYRSRNYSSRWGHYRSVPKFYGSIPTNWRNDYREHRWKGGGWNYQRLNHQQVQSNWRNWEKEKHWEKQDRWGTQNIHAQPQSRPNPSNEGNKGQKGKPKR